MTASLTMDDTWVYHYTPESKEQSKQWTVSGEPISKKTKSTLSTYKVKVIVSVFWDRKGKRITSV